MPNNDYILRSDALKALSRGSGCENICSHAIKRIPAADVEPVRLGRWVSKEGVYGVVYCSICDFELKIDNTPHCPNCGAKMDAEPPKEGQTDE